MILRSTKLVSPALSSNISDSHLCGNLHCCNYSIKVLPPGVKFIRKTFHVTDLMGTRNVEKLHVLVMHDGVTA
jgi:hypothetical protein